MSDNVFLDQFIDQRLRPRCEQMRSLYSRMASDSLQWAILLDGVPDDGTVFGDNRQSEGVHSLTGSDLRVLASARDAVIATIAAQMAIPAVLAAVTKACVRPPE